jgi:CRISPR type III-A-associated RAMP protein Csm4
MPSGLLIRLRPTGPWRIGPDSGDRDRVERVYHSDTLYSAVTGAMARLGLLEDWLDDTARAAEPAVRFSSCFPFHGEALYVMPPRTLWPPQASSKVRWKGARFVPLSAIQSLLRGKAPSEEGWAVDGASETLIAMGTQGPFRIAVRSSAAVDRGGSGVTPHSSACLEFAPNAGLWLAVAFSGEEAREKWKGPATAALRLLADSGFGGERSRGWGRAEIEVGEQRNPLVSVPAAAGDAAKAGGDAAKAAGENVWWMLSLYHPSPEDAVDWSRGNYAVITRTGRVESDAGWGETKRPTRMITEGSVLMASAEPRGSITDVAPEGFPHPVYRAGFALAIAIPLRPVAKEAPVEPIKAALLPDLAPPLSEEALQDKTGEEEPLEEEPAA